MRATNAAVMRTSNRKLILDMVRLGPVSRAELAERTHLTRAAVTQIVDELSAAGLIAPICLKGRGEHGERGRRRVQLALRPEARFAFGVSIKRARCDVGVVDLCGGVRAQESVSIQNRSPAAVLSDIARIVRAQGGALDPSRVLGIGISAPGPVDYLGGRILNPPNFEAWRDLPVCEELQARTGLPATLEKDANARALEERFFGAARAVANFMLVQIDEGVGAGVMVQGRLYRGASGLGGEIGHTSIRFDGPRCDCGHFGCLETYVRVPALLAGSGYGAWGALARDAEAPAARKILDRAAEHLGAALVNAVNLYDLERIILAGEVAECPDPLIERLNPLLRARAITRGSGPCVIAASAAFAVRTGAMPALCEAFQDRA